MIIDILFILFLVLCYIATVLYWVMHQYEAENEITIGTVVGSIVVAIPTCFAVPFFLIFFVMEWLCDLFAPISNKVLYRKNQK